MSYRLWAITFLAKFFPLLLLAITALMLGKVSQQHKQKFVLGLIIKYTAEL